MGPATEAERLLTTDTEAYDRLFKEATFKKYVFKCREFSDYYEDSARVRYDCIGVQLANPEQESEKLIDKIQMIQSMKSGNGNGHNNGNGNGNGNINGNNNAMNMN